MNLSFKAVLQKIESKDIIKIPLTISKQFPSRGMVMIQRTMNGIPFNAPLEPEIPDDIMDAIIKAGLTPQWNAITTKARWEWLRWIRSAKNPDTRKKRIDVACSKL